MKLLVKGGPLNSSYNLQCIRQLLASGAIEGVKVGQVCLVKVSSLNEYLNNIRKTRDRRFGPRVYQDTSRVRPQLPRCKRRP